MISSLLRKISCVAMLTAFGCSFMSASQTQAAYILTIEQEGANVVASGSGSLNVSDLAFIGTFPFDFDGVNPSVGTISIGNGAEDAYKIATSNIAYGSGPVAFFPDTESGTRVGIASFAGSLVVPAGYVSGTDIALSSAVFDNRTLSVIGLTPGSYVNTFGSGADTDTFTVNVIGAPTVPLPSSAPLFGAALLAFGMIGFGFKRERAA